MRKRTFWVILLTGCAALGIAAALLRVRPRGERERPVLDVYPGQDIQEALEQGAGLAVKPLIRVHEETYRPRSPGEALVWFNARHDGIVLEGVGDVVLTAANPDVASRHHAGQPGRLRELLVHRQRQRRANRAPQQPALRRPHCLSRLPGRRAPLHVHR